MFKIEFTCPEFVKEKNLGSLELPDQRRITISVCNYQIGPFLNTCIYNVFIIFVLNVMQIVYNILKNHIVEMDRFVFHDLPPIR